jgi:NDP-sugar pyrophosphorylase family protein
VTGQSYPERSSPLALANVPVAILVGGRATRLGSIATGRPKALVPVAGRPFIEHQLRLLQRHGVRRVVLCVGHLGDQIVAHVGDGSAFGIRVEYASDGPQLLGTGGAIRHALPLLGPIFWVLYGDSYLDFDYRAVLEHFLDRTEPALMTVYRNRGRWDRSNVIYHDGQVCAYDKRQPSPEMEYIDYGASLFRASAMYAIPPGRPYELADLLSQLAAARQLAGYEVTQRFYEIGSLQGLRETERYLLSVTDPVWAEYR